MHAGILLDLAKFLQFGLDAALGELRVQARTDGSPMTPLHGYSLAIQLRTGPFDRE